MLLLAQVAGYQLGNISMDGSKVHANASKRKAVSYKRLLELETQLRAEVEELFRLADQADGHAVPEGLQVTDEIALRQERLARLAEAKQVLQARVQERQAAEQAAYVAKLRQRAEQAAHTGAKRVADRPRRPQQASHKTRTSTTSPILSCAS